MSHGSPFWQGVLFFAAILFLIWEIWRGWRAGVVRSGVHLAAFVFSGLIGLAAARIAAMPFGGFGQAAGIFAGFAAGAGVGVVVFFLIWFMGALLFKRTEHQGSGLIRLFWGLGGAFFGLLVGLFILWSGISLVRGLGALAQSRVETPRQENETQPAPPPRVASGLVTLKESLELGPAGKFVQAVDPIPPDFYDLILQIGKLTNDQETMLRFIQYPGVQEVMQSPRMVELVNDPAIINASEKRDFLGLLSNKALLAAVQDPVLAEQLKKIDLRAALKFALEPPAPSPSPSPRKRPPAN
ncbi:MAG: hypothetical protein ACOYMS_07945 [Terrimicrobiaceae bacterium]